MRYTYLSWATPPYVCVWLCDINLCNCLIIGGGGGQVFSVSLVDLLAHVGFGAGVCSRAMSGMHGATLLWQLGSWWALGGVRLAK